MSKLAQRVRQESRDLLEFVLVPGLAAILPWRICYRLFKLLARRRLLYAPDCDRALHQAQIRGWARNPRAWLTSRRLTTLVDHADQYLALTRSDRWLHEHVQVDGQWPEPNKAALLCTFHWGAGMWALRHAASAGMRAHMMVARPTQEGFAGRSIFYRYIVARIASIDRILKRATLDASTNLRSALRALRANEQLMAVVDVPADQFNSSEAIELLGAMAHVPRALFRLAVDQQVPVSVFLCGIEENTGDRILHIRDLGTHDDVEGLIKAVFSELELALKDNPAAWHFWAEAERFFRAEGSSP